MDLPRRFLDQQDLAMLFDPHAPAFAEPCYCDRCDGADKLRGVPCGSCGEPMWGCSSLDCICGVLHRIRFRHRRAIMATRIQSLWRGYKTRKELKKKHADDIQALEPLWRFYDEKYRTYVVCQNFVVAFKKDDPSYDLTQTIYYRWMLENGGPWIEEAENYMRRRGWVRPRPRPLDVDILQVLSEGTFMHCGLTDEEQKVALALLDSFNAAISDE